MDFIQNNGNILLTLSGDGSVPSSLASALLEFDITLPPEKNSVVVDHFNYDGNSAAEKHDVLILNAPKSFTSSVGAYFGAHGMLAVPHAVGQVLGNANPLLTPILLAPETAYAYDPKENEAIEDVFASGTQLSLITAFQARNSARLTVLGSAEMLQDQWFIAKVVGRAGGAQIPTSNKLFAQMLTQWTFQETGVLKVGRLEHRLTDPESKEVNPDIYRIKNDVVSTQDVTTLRTALTES